MAERSFLGIVIGWRRLLIRLTFLAALGAAVVSLLLPKAYSSAAMISPPQEGQGGFGIMALMDQIGSSVGVGNTRSLLKRTPEIDLMIGVLKSRRVRGEVVDQFDLVTHYDAKSRAHAIKELGELLAVNTSPEGFIEVRVEADDGQLAADLANAFVASLDRYNRETSVADARRTIQFVESCRDDNRARLEAAMDELRRFQEKYGAVQLAEQARVTVDAISQLEAERMQLDIEKGVLQNYSRQDQPRVVEIEVRIKELEKRIAELRGSQLGVLEWDDLDGAEPPATPNGGDSDPAVSAPELDVLISLGDFPRLGLKYADLKREVMVQEKVYEFLTSQIEEARMREARDLETITVLDAAVPPIKRSRPRRTLIVILTAGLAFAVAVALAFACEGGYEAARRNPEWKDVREVRWALGGAEALRRWGGPESG